MNPMTVLGEKLLREELTRLIRKERPRVIEAIAKAREHGDLRENAEYNAAREQQGMIESRIRLLESRLANMRIIDITSIPPTGKVIFGATVTLVPRKGTNTDKDNDGDHSNKNAKEGRKASKHRVSYQIVGEDEADIENKKLSYTAPLARALIGKLKGEEVTLSNPSGKTVHYLIEEVEHK